MARGEMVRWLAETGASRPRDLPAFHGLGYQYAPDLSQENNLVFLKEDAKS